MIPLIGAAKPYKAGVLAVELCPQRLHVKPFGHFTKYVEKIKNSKKIRKSKNKLAYVQNSGVNPPLFVSLYFL
jgi:hypothetical protein